jgi:glycosyltransferase involved in cell wall biosynthesis
VTNQPLQTLDPIDRVACQDFATRYGVPRFARVVVVIPAFREGASIEAVVRQVPSVAAGLGVSTLVVVDGPDRETEQAASATDAYVCVVPVNRGQGAALRLGYRLGAAHGAEFVVTMDADGQYDPAEISTVLEPVVAGTADFVSGSRRLGTNLQDDRVREVGVVVYASIIRHLTGCSVTDPSFGLRAMRAEVAHTVELHQQQYQAAELLVGAIMHGFRVEERPATMRRRATGTSHKGPNLVYGWHFGYVIATTWFREVCRSRGRVLARRLRAADRRMA